MGPFVVVAAAAVLASVSTGAFAQAAALDCAKPRTPAERTVCANAALRALDARAFAFYSLLLEAKPASESLPYRQFRDDLQTQAQTWQRETRDACAAQVACLSNAYQHRVDELRASAMQRLGLTSVEAAASHDAGPALPSIDYKDAIYRIGENSVTLLGGQHTQAAADSSAQEVTRVIDPPEPAGGTLGGRPAVAVFLSQDGGGSGTFYYAAVAFADGRGTTFQIGDRIQPIKIAINGDDLVVTYLDRKADEPMAVPPTVPRERHFAYMNDQLVERPQATAAAK